MGKELVTYLSHVNTERVREDFRRLRRESGNRRTVLLYHEKISGIRSGGDSGGVSGGESGGGNARDSADLPDPCYRFTMDILEQMEYPALGESLYGNVHFPLFAYWRKHLRGDGIDHLWFVEYDVAFTGSWDYLFDYFEDSDADLIASHIQRYDEHPGWPWWRIEHPRETLPRDDRIRSFNPIYRLSSKALAFLDKAFRKGWKGHHEVTIPTLLHNNGFSLLDFGNRGTFVDDALENFYYSYSLRNIFKGLGTMRHRPVFKRPGLLKNTLYHPVKPERGEGKLAAAGYYLRKLFSSYF